MQKQITQQFRTFGTDTSAEINTFMETKLARGEVYNIEIVNMYSFDKAFVGSSEKWLMVVFLVSVPYKDDKFIPF